MSNRGNSTFGVMKCGGDSLEFKGVDDETTMPGPMGERMDKPEATEQAFREGSFETPQMGMNKVSPMLRQATSPEATPTPKQEALEADPHTAADVIPSKLALGSAIGKVVPHSVPQVSKKLVKAGAATVADTGGQVFNNPTSVASKRYEKGIKAKDILIKQFKEIDEGTL